MKIQIDEIIRSKRKSLQITVTKEARLVVRAPLKLSFNRIEQFIEDKRDWIIQKQTEAARNKEKYFRRAYLSGEYFPYLGTHYILNFSDTTRAAYIDGNHLIFPSMYLSDAKHKIEGWYKKQAQAHIKQRLSTIAHTANIPFQSCRITQARQRWGSCSGKNALNFTWRLIMAHPKAIDYVVIHELCHILHKNHSKQFWISVEQLMPDYRIWRKWLKDNQYILDI